MLFTQYPRWSLPIGFLLSKQLTQIIESTYTYRVLRYAYDATVQGEFLSP